MKLPTTKLLDDWIKMEDFARDIKRHPRTVRRWMLEPDGLPYTRLGKTPIIHMPTARQWLLGRMQYPKAAGKRPSMR
jgi:hypothetical protein